MNLRDLTMKVEELLSTTKAILEIHELLDDTRLRDDVHGEMRKYVGQMMMGRGHLFTLLAIHNDDHTHELYRTMHEDGEGDVVLVHRNGRPYRFAVWHEYEGDICSAILYNDLEEAMRNVRRRGVEGPT